MADKYEYHKQNDYPGERIAERKRVADVHEEAEKKADSRVAAADRRSDARVAEKGRTEGLKADARVAEKGRTEGLKADARVAGRGKMDDDLMDAEIQRSTARAQEINRERDRSSSIGVIIGTAIVLILLAGLGWSNMVSAQKTDEIDSQSNEISYLNSQVSKCTDVQLSDPAVQGNRLTDTTRPEIVSITPANDGKDISTDAKMTIVFSEDIEPKSVDANTITIVQRAIFDSGLVNVKTLEGAVYTSGNTVVFDPTDRFWPDQQYGNVFIVTIKDSVEDLAGNSLSRDHVWTFTTGMDRYYTVAATTSRTG